MRCPACRKKVVFGSVTGESWKRLHAGEFLLGGRPPAPGKLGDCPVCGGRLEWEPEDPPLDPGGLATSSRVHLSALREAPARYDGREIWMRALLIVQAAASASGAGSGFLSDSWRNRSKDAAETDAELLIRLAREQQPAIAAILGNKGVAAQFLESSRELAVPDARAAWIEVEGLFRARPEGGELTVVAISSIWPVKD